MHVMLKLYMDWMRCKVVWMVARSMKKEILKKLYRQWICRKSKKTGWCHRDWWEIWNTNSQRAGLRPGQGCLLQRAGLHEKR